MGVAAWWSAAPSSDQHTGGWVWNQRWAWANSVSHGGGTLRTAASLRFLSQAVAGAGRPWTTTNGQRKAKDSPEAAAVSLLWPCRRRYYRGAYGTLGRWAAVHHVVLRGNGALRRKPMSSRYRRVMTAKDRALRPHQLQAGEQGGVQSRPSDSRR